MCCTNILGCVIVFGGMLAAIVCVVGLAVPVWSSDSVTATESSVVVKTITYEGLWQVCTIENLDDSNLDCNYLWDSGRDHTSAKKATLAFIVMGLAFIVICFVLMTLAMTLCGTIKKLPKIAGTFAIAAGVFILIGIIVYGTKVKDDLGADLHSSWGLCLVSSIACLIVGVLCFLVSLD